VTWWYRVATGVCAAAERTGLSVVVLGKAIKPDPELIARSSAALLMHDLDRLGLRARWWDPQVDSGPSPLRFPAVFVIMVRYAAFANPRLYPTGSVVIDPYRYVSVPSDVELIFPR